MSLAHGTFSVATQNNDLGLVPRSISLSGFSGDSRKKGGRKRDRDLCRAVLHAASLGQGGGLITWLTFQSPPALKYEPHALLGDMHRWMSQRPVIHPTGIHWAPTKCHGLVVNTTEKSLHSPSLER